MIMINFQHTVRYFKYTEVHAVDDMETIPTMNYGQGLAVWGVWLRCIALTLNLESGFSGKTAAEQEGLISAWCKGLPNADKWHEVLRNRDEKPGLFYDYEWSGDNYSEDV